MQNIFLYHHVSGEKACFNKASFFPCKKGMEQYDLGIWIISEALEIFISVSRIGPHTCDIEKRVFSTQFWARKGKHHFRSVLHTLRRAHSLFWLQKEYLVRNMWAGCFQDFSEIFIGNYLKRGDLQRWQKLVCQFTIFELLKNPGNKMFWNHFSTRANH